METLGENLSNVVTSVSETAGEGVKSAVSTTTSLLQNKTVLMIAGVVVVLLVAGYFMGWFGENSKENFANYNSLEDIKASERAVYVFLKMRGCGWCTKADGEGGSWNELEKQSNNGQLKVNGNLVDLVKADSGETPGLFNEVSKAVKARGYPTFVLCKKGQFKVFNDKRNADAMKNFISSNI